MRADHTGDITLRVQGDKPLAYAKLWPHVRPWQLFAPEPMLRDVPQAGAVAPLLCRTLVAGAEAARRAERQEAEQQEGLRLVS